MDGRVEGRDCANHKDVLSVLAFPHLLPLSKLYDWYIIALIIDEEYLVEEYPEYDEAAG